MKFLEKYDFKGKTTVLKNGISKYFQKENLFPDNQFNIQNKNYKSFILVYLKEDCLKL